MISLESLPGYASHPCYFHRDRCEFFWSHNLPIAAFFQAASHRAGLSPLFHRERGPAFRTRLGEGPVRSREVAFRIAVTPVEHAAAPLAGHALQQFPGAAFRTGDAQRFGANKFTFWICRAAGELAVLAVPPHQLR